MTFRKKNAVDQYGDTVETARYPKKDAEALLRFNVTGQRIADLCNEERKFFPWDNEVHRSTWNRALNGHPVWDEIVSELDGLYYSQVRDPRAYLPGPPTDDLFDWMKQIAGATWWVQVLGLDVKANTLTAWMTRGAKQDVLDDLKERVSEWWSKVDAACLQADMVRAFHAMQRHERAHGRDSRKEWDGVWKSPESFDSYFYTYVHEDGHTVDEARAHYVEMATLACDYWLSLLDLEDPKPVASLMRSRDTDQKQMAQEFDDMWARGLDEAMPREMPEGTDLSDTITEGQWLDRRYEEGPYDVNQGLYKLFYRQRSSWRWNRSRREPVAFNVEVIAVSDDGQEWRAPTDRQRRGWEHPGLEIAKWREEHGESPDNQYTRAVSEAKLKYAQARNAVTLRGAEGSYEARVAQQARASQELQRALSDY